MKPALETKLFEIRDHATRIVVMVTKLQNNAPEYFRQRRMLFSLGLLPSEPPRFAYTELSSMKTAEEPWQMDRTQRTAFKFIKDAWDGLSDGAVVDVRYILGETDEPCPSDFG